MNDTKQALEAVVGLVRKATPGEWMLATSCSWRRVVTTEHRPVITPITQRSDNHPDLEAGEDHVNLEASIAAVNFLRTHGPALLAALEDARRYRWLRQSHWYIGPEPEGDTEGVGLHDYNDGTIDAAIDAMAAGGESC